MSQNGSYEEQQKSSPLSGGNAAFVEAAYEQYLNDPASVAASWQKYFASLGSNNGEVAHGPIRAAFVVNGQRYRASAAGSLDAAAAAKQSAVLRLINYYRVRGHQVADLDPLGLAPKVDVPDLDPAFHGLSTADLDASFDTGSMAIGQSNLPLREILRILKHVYTGTIGAEYMYITATPEKRWIQQRLEGTAFQPRLSNDERREILRQLTAAEGIERYLHTKYVGQKRFSLEGGDSLIPSLDEVIRSAARHQTEEVLIGMAHRGRLNVLVNILGKSPKDLFEEFEGKHVTAKDMSGDVKYHMGFSTDVEADGARMHMVLAFNPSHLEIVNPVVLGSVRARQDRRGDTRGKSVLPVLIHGDAAFAGQGVVMETLQLSKSKGYGTGGTLHIVVNNQIGFTTPNPIEVREGEDSRTSLYCTDLAKMLEAPVFHVNGDDPEAVAFVTRMAMDYREAFCKDVFIDLICYRRHGHNEADEPAATQPVMYAKIRQHPTTRALYAERLAADQVIAADDADKLVEEYRDGLDKGINCVRKTLGLVGNPYTVDWSNYNQGDWATPAHTGVPAAKITELYERLDEDPEGFKLHPRLVKIIEDRHKMARGEQPMDWGFGEIMAYASLLDDGERIRLSGQDTGRGTFFHRHAERHNQVDGSIHVPLKDMARHPDDFVVINSLLSEEGVLGFEYGYSTADPGTLVIWEAQFGDFANGAQVLVDQFISSGYAKWGRLCGLTMLLPHGFEGQGPEHSSARLERYLQLCAGNNMQVCVPSTPAQMFHLLRRQVIRPYRLPLIVMTPKSLLRHKLAVSTLDDLEHGCFQLVIPDASRDAAAVKRVVLCSGKVYYDLLQTRDEEKLEDVAIVRIEQLYPFPNDDYAAVLKAYPNAREIVWCQEEPENQGAWYPTKHRINNGVKSRQTLFYATRPGAASTAVGYAQLHAQQQAALVREALHGGMPFKG